MTIEIIRKKGFAISLIAFPVWQGTSIIVGLMLLNNPDIELISVVGAFLMCLGYLPWGVKLLHAE